MTKRTERASSTQPQASKPCPVYSWCVQQHAADEIDQAGFRYHACEPIEVEGIGAFLIAATTHSTDGHDEPPEIMLNDEAWGIDEARSLRQALKDTLRTLIDRMEVDGVYLEPPVHTCEHDDDGTATMRPSPQAPDTKEVEWCDGSCHNGVDHAATIAKWTSHRGYTFWLSLHQEHADTEPVFTIEVDDEDGPRTLLAEGVDISVTEMSAIARSVLDLTQREHCTA